MKSEASSPHIHVTAAPSAASTEGAAASAVRPTNVQDMSTLPFIDSENRGVLSESEQASGQKALLKGIFEEYYKRGVNILKPEIILTSEYVPIRKSFEEGDNTGLNIDYGSGQIGVNAVLQLLELHQNVQKSVNQASMLYLGQVIRNIDPSSILAEMRTVNLSDDLLGTTLNETVENYLEFMKGDVSLGTSQFLPSPDQAAIATPREAAVSSTSEPVFVTFRDLISSSVVNEREMIKSLAEIIVIERVMLSVGEYFKDIVLLRKRILELLSVAHMKAGSEGVEGYLSTTLGDMFKAVNKYLELTPNVSNSVSTEASSGILTQGNSAGVQYAQPHHAYSFSEDASNDESITNSLVSPVSTGKPDASSFLAGVDIANFGLNAAQISGADSNSLILFQLFLRVMSLLDPSYCHQGVLWPADDRLALRSLWAEPMVSFVPESSRDASRQLVENFKGIGLSSLSPGQVFVRKFSRNNGGKGRVGNQTVRDHIYSSRIHVVRPDLKNYLPILSNPTTSDLEQFYDNSSDEFGLYNDASYNEGSSDNVSDDVFRVRSRGFNVDAARSYSFLKFNPRRDELEADQTGDIANNYSAYNPSGNPSPRSSMLAPGEKPYEYSLLAVGELLSIICFDIVMDLNRRKGAGGLDSGAAGDPAGYSDASGNGKSLGVKGLRRYFQSLLGTYGVNPVASVEIASPSDLSVGMSTSYDTFSKVVNPLGYNNTSTAPGNTELRTAASHTGQFHQAFFANYPIIEDADTPAASTTGGVAMLPSEVNFIEDAYKHLPGNIGIITEAFVNDSFSGLNDHVDSASNMVGNFCSSILKLTSLAQVGNSSSNFSDAYGYHGSAGSQNPTPSWYARKILEKLGEGIETAFKSTNSEWASVKEEVLYIVEGTLWYGDDNYAEAYGDDEAARAEYLLSSGESLLEITNSDYAPTGQIYSFQGRDIYRYFLPLLFLVAAGEDNQDNTESMLAALAGNVHYNHLLLFRNQYYNYVITDDYDRRYNGAWFQFAAFDNLNKMIEIFGQKYFGSDASGNPGSSTTENDEYYGFNGQYKDYVGNLSESDQACFGQALIAGKKVLLGPTSTAELFESVEKHMPAFFLARNETTLTNFNMNEHITELFMAGGLDTDREIVQNTSGDESHGPIIDGPVMFMKKHIEDNFESYNSLFKISGDLPPLIGKYTGVTINNKGSGTAARDDSVYIEQHYYVPDNETPGLTGGPHRTNDTQRDFAVISTISKLLGSSLNVRVFGQDDGLTIRFLPHQMQAITDVLGGRLKKTASDLVSRSSNNLFMKSSNFDEIDDYTERTIEDFMMLEDGNDSDGYKLYSETYDNCREALSQVMKASYDKENSIRICLSALLKHVSNLGRVKEEVINITDSSKRDPMTNLGLNFAGQLSDEMSSTSNLSNIKTNLIRHVTQASLPTFYKNTIDLLFESKSSPVYTPSDALSDEQLRLMTIALTGLEEYGLSEKEKMGKKSIVSVGLPGNMLDYLQYEGFRTLGANAISSEGDNSILTSPYVCVQLFKKDSLGGQLLYYPKIFLFNTDIFVAENYAHGFFGVDALEHLEQAYEIGSFEDLYEKFEMLRVNYDSSVFDLGKVSGNAGMLSENDDLMYLEFANDDYTNFPADPGQGLLEIAKREMKINHMLDHYLKMYQKLSVGIDVNEYVFPTNPNFRISQNLNVGRTSTQSRIDRRSLRDRLSNELLLSYPSANVDANLARELARLDKNMKKSNIFTGYEKCKNLIGPKSFSRVFTMLVNEGDFAIYPYPDQIFLDKTTSGTLGDVALSTKGTFESLADLYDPLPKFTLGAGRQLSGISGTGKAQAVYDVVVSNTLAGLAGNVIESSFYNDNESEAQQILKHMNDVEGEGVVDVYEIFAVVSLVKRR